MAADTVVYVSCAGSKAVRILAMDRTTGALAPIETAAVPGTDQPSPSSMPLAVSHDRRFLYAALRSEPYCVSSFAIAPATGRLTHLSTAPLVDSMCYLVADRTGHFLLSASYPGAKLAINPIDAEGRAGGEPTQVIATPPKAHCVLLDPGNRFCYATSLEADLVMHWQFDETLGVLSPEEPHAIATPPGNGPRHLAFHPNRRFLYLLTETTARLAGYAIDTSSGALAEIELVDTLPADFAQKPAAADLHVTPDGRFLYASERRSSALAGFRIDGATGRLTPIGRFPTETTPRGFAIDPRGRFLLSAGLDSDGLRVHPIDQVTGALSPGANYPMGRMPNWVEIVDLR